MGVILLSALVAHTGWHWMTERWGVLSQYPVDWVSILAVTLTTAAPWLLLPVIGALGWHGWRMFRQPSQPNA